MGERSRKSAGISIMLRRWYVFLTARRRGLNPLVRLTSSDPPIQVFLTQETDTIIENNPFSTTAPATLTMSNDELAAEPAHLVILPRNEIRESFTDTEEETLAASEPSRSDAETCSYLSSESTLAEVSEEESEEEWEDEDNIYDPIIAGLMFFEQFERSTSLGADSTPSEDIVFLYSLFRPYPLPRSVGRVTARGEKLDIHRRVVNNFLGEGIVVNIGPPQGDYAEVVFAFKMRDGVIYFPSALMSVTTDLSEDCHRRRETLAATRHAEDHNHNKGPRTTILQHRRDMFPLTSFIQLSAYIEYTLLHPWSSLDL